MKEHIIFKPEMMFQNFINSCWSQNIETTEKNKIFVNSYLFKRGIYALDIIPDNNKDFYVFGLPVNKNWQAQNFKTNSKLNFEIYSENNISINVFFQNSKNVNSDYSIINIDSITINKWSLFKIPLKESEDLRMILFSGSAKNTLNYVIKNITIS
jgi:hypothetical protein